VKRAVLIAILSLALAASARAAVLQAIGYPRFADACGKDPYCVTFKELGAQLDWLKAEGWASVGLTQVARALDGSEALPPKAVLLSVDDGYKAGARGADLFEARGFKGAFFINPAALAKGRRAARSAFLDAEGVRALERRGHDIGSHTRSHPNLGKPLAGQTPQAYRAWVADELRGSREDLQAILGHPVTDLAWPFGAYNNALVAAAQAAGYRQCWTVTDAAAELPGSDRLRLPRTLLMRPLGLASFRRRVDAASSPAALAGLRDGEIEYSEGGVHGFRFVTGTAGGRLQRIMIQRAKPAWRPYFDALSTPAESDPPHAP
jgi:peptidoglycan/xylan/chitin deacetylase (PgdA/CDA1 family)